MTKSELREMIREMAQTELSKGACLQEAVADGAGYVIRAWEEPEQKGGKPKFDSAERGVLYHDFADVKAALNSDELNGLGAYEIIWVGSDETAE